MKDSLDILMPNACNDNFIEHHGVKGMKWGVRKKYVTTGATGHTTSEKINSIISSSKGAHRRGNGLSGTMPGGIVGGGNSYPGSIEGGAISSSGNMTEKELVELHNKTIDDIRNSATYSEIFKLAEQLKSMSDSRRMNLEQQTTATEMVFEAKADKIIEQINDKLKGLDSSFAKETSIIKNFDKGFSPSKWVLSDLSEKKSSSAALGLNRATGRVSKGWNRPSTVPSNAKGYTFKRKEPWEK